MDSHDDRRAQQEARREVAGRRPSERESRSESMLRRYLGGAFYAVLRRGGASREGPPDQPRT